MRRRWTYHMSRLLYFLQLSHFDKIRVFRRKDIYAIPWGIKHECIYKHTYVCVRQTGRPVVKIIVESLSQHDEKYVLTTPIIR
jgi:hypothetical protein